MSLCTRMSLPRWPTKTSPVGGLGAFLLGATQDPSLALTLSCHVYPVLDTHSSSSSPGTRAQSPSSLERIIEEDRTSPGCSAIILVLCVVSVGVSMGVKVSGWSLRVGAVQVVGQVRVLCVVLLSVGVGVKIEVRSVCVMVLVVMIRW